MSSERRCRWLRKIDWKEKRDERGQSFKVTLRGSTDRNPQTDTDPSRLRTEDGSDVYLPFRVLDFIIGGFLFEVTRICNRCILKLRRRLTSKSGGEGTRIYPILLSSTCPSLVSL